MKVVYASRTGNVQKLIDRLGVEALKIVDGSEKMDGEYILITYTDGDGIIPAIVDKFIENNREGFKLAAVSGNMERHPHTFCYAAGKLEEKYGVKILIQFDKEGDKAVDKAIKEVLG